MQKTELRIIRIPIPVRLIREIDKVIIAGIGGYDTRAEFIVDAIQERVYELTIEEIEAAHPSPVKQISEPVEPVGSTERPNKGANLKETELKVPDDGFTVSAELNISRPDRMPLFGLHNRDYPSLWALSQLAAFTKEGPIPLESFYSKIILKAWEFGELLMILEQDFDRKLSGLFPTNTEKRKQAEAGFCNFAIGGYRGIDGQRYQTTGPLFGWHAVGLMEGDDASPLIGLTSAGRELLRGVNGLSVEVPHSIGAADAFINHLRLHASADLAVFVEIARVIGTEGANRKHVLEHMTDSWSDWTINEVSTNSAGYIARAREWGLVQLKQTRSMYQLTPYGIEFLDGVLN